jgi:methylenetetrahydrofolate dehydrogenase (NADP+)/methenyltetrahydrofolate cyclohydrolase
MDIEITRHPSGAVILDGSATSKAIRRELKSEVSGFVAETGIRPTLAAILAGDNLASQKYVAAKEKACALAGIGSRTFPFLSTALQAEVEDVLAELNSDPLVHGILIQHPLPKTMDEPAVLSQLDPDKDVDGISPISMGRLLAGMEAIHACTPAGIMELLRIYEIPVAGKHAVVVGRSVILGKPMAILLLDANATVTICHSKTKNLAEITRQADILVAAIGKPEFFTGDMIKPGAVVLDAGYNHVEGRQGDVGDVDFESAAKVASAITPVPGGVGPMTIAMLLKNTFAAAKKSVGSSF